MIELKTLVQQSDGVGVTRYFVVREYRLFGVLVWTTSELLP